MKSVDVATLRFALECITVLLFHINNLTSNEAFCII